MFSTTFRGKIHRYPMGIIVATPFFPSAQGAYFLTRFRRNHKDAPYPLSSSRGIVIVSPRDYGGHASMDYEKVKDVRPAEERKRWRWRRRQNTNEDEKHLCLFL
jgi:hypothetical protein